ncbi:MAG: hypothetical protein M3416_10250, partial [Acidobacteriota bacterium]|nr:hypothetical protein [Acidobacteriota bacterium]
MTHTPAHVKALALLGLGLALAAPAALAEGAQRRARARARTPAPPQTGPAKPAAQQPEARMVSSSAILVQWQGTPGVNRYRLQLATDEKFQDIVFDQAVEGRQYIVRGLPKGDYFWRVAPAAAETSPFYTPPQRVAVSGSGMNVAPTPAPTAAPNAPAAPRVFQPDESTGWRT